MKHTHTRRVFSFLTALAMVVSLLAGLSITVFADTLLGTPTGYTSASQVVYDTSGDYLKNWGARGETASFLTTYAQNYYTGSYTYASLSANAGSSSSSGYTTSALYTALHAMLAAKQTTTTSYNGTRDMYRYTDCVNNNSDYISSFYSGTKLNGAWDSGATWNREHTWPQSKSTGDQLNDIMMLRPTAKDENTARSNKAYGESDGYYHPNTEVGSTGLDLRGDCARIMLYCYVRWSENADNMWGTSGVIESVSVLLNWMEQDPVDTWEMGRNDVVQTITGARNCFVDYPELAFQLFGQSVPSNYPTPSNGQGGSTPATVTVTYMANGALYQTETTTSGQSVTLPASATAVTDWTFYGWVTAELSETTTQPSFYTPGSSYTPTSDVTLYALYMKSEGGSGSGAWTKMTDASTLSAGLQVVLACTEKSVTAGDISSQVMASTSSTFSADGLTITTLSGDALVLTVGGSADAWTFANANGQLLGATAVKKLAWGSGVTTWSVSITDGDATIQNATASYGRFLYNYSSPRFTTYTSATSTSMFLPQLYYLDGTLGTVHYTTSPSGEHVHTMSYVEALAPTCGATGHTAYWHCAVCGKYFSDAQGETEITLASTILPATGEHSWGSWTYNQNDTHKRVCTVCSAMETDDCSYTETVTAPTPTEQGYTTHTCEVCGHSFVDTYTDPTGADYTLTFSVLGDTTVVAPMTCNSITGVTLPTAVGPEGYSFLGWVHQDYDNVSVHPTGVLTGHYTAQEDQTLLALFTYSPTGASAEPVLVQMTAENTLAVGDKLVIRASGTDYALYQENSGTTYVKNYTFTSSAAAVAADEKNWITVNTGTEENTWTLGDADNGYLYNASSNNLTLSSSATDFVLGTVLDSNNAFVGFTMTSTGGRYLSCRTDLTTANANLWRMGGTGTPYGTTTLELYKLTTASADAIYTTLLPGSCEHSFGAWSTNNNGTHSRTCALCGYIETESCTYTDVVTAPTATEQGYTTHSCEICGYSFADSYTDPLGYDYTVTFSVLGDTTVVAPMSSNTMTGITLPTAPAPEGYTFQGWVLTDCDNAAVRPETVLTGAYTAEGDVTLLALFSYVEGTEGSSSWVSTAADDVTEGSYLIGAIAGETTANIFHFANGTVSNDMAVTSETAVAVNGSISGDLMPADAAVFTLTGNNTDGFAVSLSAAGEDPVYLGYTSATASRRLALSADYSGVLWQAIEKEGLNDNGLYLSCTTGTYAISQNSTNVASAIRGYYTGTAYTPIYLFRMEQTGTTYYTTVLPAAHEHSPAAPVVENNVEPSCTEAGGYDEVVYCSSCGAELSRSHVTMAALGHDYQVYEVVAPTCTEEGYTVYKCSRCGDEDMRDITDALGHSFIVLVDEVAPTCTETGIQEYKCSRCDETTLVETAALGHNPAAPVQENYVEPTATEAGGYDMVVYCQRCNAELSREHTTLEPTGPNEPVLNENLTFYTSVSIGVEIKTTFTIRQNVLNNYSSWYLEVSKLDGDGNVLETKRFGEGQDGAVSNVNNVAWRAIYTDITAKEMGVTFSAVLHVFDADGNEFYGNAVQNTVKDYVVGELLKTDNTAATRTLCADMLNYGAAAQLYFAYDTDNLVNENLSAAAAAALDQFETKTEAPATLVNGSNGPNLYGSVSIKNRVVLGITARGVSAEGTVQIQVKKQGASEVKEVLETTKVGSVYTAKFSNVEANEMRDMFEFTILVDGVETGTPLLWSVEGYVRAARLNTSISAEELALLNALLIYTDSAAALN